jgi:hypothetical protein
LLGKVPRAKGLAPELLDSAQYLLRFNNQLARSRNGLCRLFKSNNNLVAILVEGLKAGGYAIR